LLNFFSKRTLPFLLLPNLKLLLTKISRGFIFLKIIFLINFTAVIFEKILLNVWFAIIIAAIGIGLDISQPIGNIIVDIGGGTTEIAVIALSGVVTKETIRVAGDEMDEALVQWFRNEHKLDIGISTGEAIKKSVGSAMRMKSETISVKGRDLVSGIPKTIDVTSDEVRQALKDPVSMIVEAVKKALERTPPELSADILDRGIIMTGGGSILKGMDQIIRERTNVPVNIAEDPLLSVVRGTGMVLEDIKKYEAVLI